MPKIVIKIAIAIVPIKIFMEKIVAIYLFIGGGLVLKIWEKLECQLKKKSERQVCNSVILAQWLLVLVH